MKASTFGLYAAACGALAGLAAIGGGLYAHSVQPEFGTPGFFGLEWDLGFSGVGMLTGMGVIMVVGGLLALKWPSLGASIVCVAAMIGLVYTFDRGEGRGCRCCTTGRHPGFSRGSPASSPGTPCTRGSSRTATGAAPP